MPKAKAKKVTPKPKAKTKPKPKPKPAELTKAEKFYIENNEDKTNEQLAEDLNKPLPIIQQHIHHTQSPSRINKLLIREKGCVVMTEGASMAADKTRKGYVSEQAIREAVAKGDYDEAARLQAIMKAQRGAIDQTILERQEEYIHHIKR